MSLRLVPIAVLGLVLLLGASEYSVDSSGGPADLEAQVSAAFAPWIEVEASAFTASLTDEASTGFRYGEQARMGPDTVSLTVQSVREGERSLQVLLAPNQDSLLDRALRHEAGLVAGLTPSRQGLMNPVLSAEGSVDLTDADRDALEKLGIFSAEDINRDGAVDFYDLASLGAVMGESGLNRAADINKDGLVDRKDLELLRAAYVFSEPSDKPPGLAEAAEQDASADQAEEGLPEVPALTPAPEEAEAPAEASDDPAEEEPPEDTSDGP